MTGRASLDRLLASPPALPVVAGLERVAAALREHRVAVVQAPPGSGKTTLVPPCVAALLDERVGGGGRVVVTQPRRIAVRAAARRLAQLLDEPVGETVGYGVRGDRRAGPRTQVEFVTTGVLLRRLQRDPELPGVGAVVLDEVHERQLDADLALALAVDVRAHLREDLLLVAMSATVEAERTAAALGSPGATAPVVDVPGALHPVEVRWCPPPGGVHWADDRGVTPGHLDHVAATVRRAVAEHTGSVLVFVPGAAEVDGVVRRLADLRSGDVPVLPLHGRLPSTEQDRALADGPGRRVVVSTAVAESSLTVPGVRVVVDAGLSREPRTDQRRGLAGLVTVRVSRAGAEQRALEVLGGSGGGPQTGEPGLDPALALDEVAAQVAAVDVRPQPLGLRRGQLAVQERAGAAAEVPDHGATCSTGAPAYRSRPSTGARWASAWRSCVRPRWMRERTVPILTPRTSAISS